MYFFFFLFFLVLLACWDTGSNCSGLMGEFFDKGYILFTNNYYNSTNLKKVMSQRSTYTCGTILYSLLEIKNP